jgi:hypothetical protein
LSGSRDHRSSTVDDVGAEDGTLNAIRWSRRAVDEPVEIVDNPTLTGDSQAAVPAELGESVVLPGVRHIPMWSGQRR